MSGKINVARFVYHFLPSGNMMLEIKHRCPSCGMLPDLNTYYDHYLTCALSKKYKTTHLISLTLKLDKLHISPLL